MKTYTYTCSICKKAFSGKRRHKGNVVCSAECLSIRRKGNQFARGYKHSEAALEMISSSSKAMWSNPLRYLAQPRGEAHPHFNPNRKEVEDRLGKALVNRFTKAQRNRLLKAYCEFCASTTRLELDHKLAVMNGGTNLDSNAQTLCKKCNILKREQIDKRIAAKWGELLETPDGRCQLQDNQQPSTGNSYVLPVKVQRLTGEELTNKPDTSAPHSAKSDDIVRTTR